jgi:hypothetical protein
VVQVSGAGQQIKVIFGKVKVKGQGKKVKIRKAVDQRRTALLSSS